MDTYLLLRSNKQSGPYTLQQLVNTGLKPYDLVWVEGKSAAWRYPSEVDNLKEYAPSTEEQPFDRFYKKTEEKKSEEKPVQKIIQKPAEVREEVVQEVMESKTSAPKKVFVSMPVNGSIKKPAKTFTTTTTTPPIVESKPVIKEERSEPKIESKPIHTPEERYEPITKEKKTVKEEAVLSENYSESLDEIKKRYTETYLNRKKRSGWTSTHTSIVQVFGGALFFCLLVVIVYKNFSGDESSQLARTTVIQPNKNDINKNSNTQAVTNTTTTLARAVKETNKPKEKRQQPVRNELNPPAESLATIPVSQKNEESIEASDYSVAATVTEKKNEIPRSEEVKPKVRPVNIHKLVNVRANAYKQLAFGGVKNLELTVNNDSKFTLDKVTVELQYLKPSEQPIKTEKIVFNSVAAGDSKTLRIPDFTRGVKISYRVVDIESSQYDRQTAGL